ncbi:MAG: hypothetical protein KDD49_07945, partial [Bacteroidetes bacterium]|nr:hypothetical protein [Bacteroidota bacterium]
DLAYEFDFSDKKEIEKKIKRKIKYYNLGDYSQERVEYIRTLKNDLYREISLQTKSKYFSKSNSNFADLKDFKFEQMTADYCKKYNKITELDMSGIVNFAIYLYHMR